MEVFQSQVQKNNESPRDNGYNKIQGESFDLNNAHKIFPQTFSFLFFVNESYEMDDNISNELLIVIDIKLVTFA